MKLIRSLVIPWFLFFILAIAGIVALGIKYTKFQAKGPQFIMGVLAAGALLCIMANLNSLSNVGIWISESLPESIRYTSWRWIVRAFKSVLIAAVFWFIGQLPWAPLIWNAAVVPAVGGICLFVFIWSLIGPILKWSSNLAWSRAFSVFLSLPVFATVPVAAFFLGGSMVEAFRASHADLQSPPVISTDTADVSEVPEEVTLKSRLLSISATQLRLISEWPVGSGEEKTLEIDLSALTPKQVQALPKSLSANAGVKEFTLTVPSAVVKEAAVQSGPSAEDKDIRNHLRSPKSDVRANALRSLFESGKSCADYAKEIQLSLDPKASKNVAFWAIKDLECAGIHAAVGMPRLVSILMEHESPQVRAAAIRGLKHYGDENVRTVAYILVRRLGENEPPEVVEAASSLLWSLGGDQQHRVINKLKTLLNVDKVSTVAAKSLIKDAGRDDLVAEYVAGNLTGSKDARNRAVAMICLLPQDKRSIAETNISEVVASIRSADPADPGLRALDCLGHAGFEAIRQEVSSPHQIDRTVAAHALAELETKEVPETIETANLCVHDSNPQVRKWCSQSLGEIGAPALPKILELLKSSDTNLKEAGKTALQFFKDPSAEQELKRIMADNSGWMANNKNLQIAKAVGTAVKKIESRDVGHGPAAMSAPNSLTK